MDEYVDELLNSDACLDIVLSRIPKRPVLEDSGVLEPRISALEEDLVDEEEPEKEKTNEIIDNIKENKDESGLVNEDLNEKKHKKHKKHRKKSRSHSRHKEHKGKDKNNWRKIVKNKKSRSRSRDNKKKSEEKTEKNDKKQGKVEEFSVEYWNKLRAEIGLKPLT